MASNIYKHTCYNIKVEPFSVFSSNKLWTIVYFKDYVAISNPPVPCIRRTADIDHNWYYQGPVSQRILSLETDLSSLITLVTIVFSMLKITRGLKIFSETGPRGIFSYISMYFWCSYKTSLKIDSDTMNTLFKLILQGSLSFPLD